MGFIPEEESPELMHSMVKHTQEVFERAGEELKGDEPSLKTRVKNGLRKYLQKNLERRPMIIPILLKSNAEET